MKAIPRFLGTVAVLSLLFMPVPASAGLITIHFTGHVTDGWPEFLGLNLTGSLVIDDSFADTDSDPAQGRFDGAIVAISGVLSDGGVTSYAFSGPNPVGQSLVKQVRASSYDYLQMVSDVQADSTLFTAIDIFMRDDEKSAYTGAVDVNSMTPFAGLGAFEFGRLTLINWDTGHFGNGVIDTITVVPEPASLCLIGLGMVLGARRRIIRESSRERR